MPRREPGVAGPAVSEASDGFRSSRDTAVGCPDLTGVVLPEGVLCLLKQLAIISTAIPIYKALYPHACTKKKLLYCALYPKLTTHTTITKYVVGTYLCIRRIQ